MACGHFGNIAINFVELNEENSERDRSMAGQQAIDDEHAKSGANLCDVDNFRSFPD